MTKLSDELATQVDRILGAGWNIRDGLVVPSTSDVALNGGGVRLDATMLYADLVDSTSIAMNWDDRVAAKYFKAFLTCCCRLIRAEGGEIRSFDGDRVMGVFVGGPKNTRAMRCALKINWAFLKVVKPKLEAKYSSAKNYTLQHCVGVDTSKALVVRAGVRGDNDLVWVGRSPNIAAKLSTMREKPYYSWVTKAAYKTALDEVKISSDGRQMWEERTCSELPSDVNPVYRSLWTWVP